MPLSPIAKLRSVVSIATTRDDQKIDGREVNALNALAGAAPSPAVNKLLVGLYNDGPARFQNREVWRQFGNSLANRGIKLAQPPPLLPGKLPDAKTKKGLQPLEQVKAAIAALVHADDGKLSNDELQATLRLAATPDGKKLDKAALKELVKQYQAGDSRFESAAVRRSLRTELLNAGVKGTDLGGTVALADFDKLSKTGKMQALFPAYVAGRDEEVFGEFNVDPSFKTATVNPAKSLKGAQKTRALDELAALTALLKKNVGADSVVQKPTVTALSRDGKLFGYTVSCAGETWEQTRAFDRNFQPIGNFEIFE